jgi:hypothetical protein
MDTMLENIVRQLESPERAFELLYWSREPELLDVIRAVAAMPAASQAALGVFLAMSDEGQGVTATYDANGDLVLAAPKIEEALAEVLDTRETRIEIAPALSQRIH